MLDELIELILDDAREHMDKTLTHLQGELNAIRAGRASPVMLQNVRVAAGSQGHPRRRCLLGRSGKRPDRPTFRHHPRRRCHPARAARDGYDGLHAVPGIEHAHPYLQHEPAGPVAACGAGRACGHARALGQAACRSWIRVSLERLSVACRPRADRENALRERERGEREREGKLTK